MTKRFFEHVAVFFFLFRWVLIPSIDKIPLKTRGESCFLGNSGISKWYKQHWYERFHRFHPSSFESTPSCWQIPWGVGQGHLPQHCYAQAGDWWESPQCMIYCMLKVSFWSNFTELWLMSLNVNQPNKFLILGLLRLVNHHHFTGLSVSNHHDSFRYPKGPSSLFGYYCSTLCFQP